MVSLCSNLYGQNFWIFEKWEKKFWTQFICLQASGALHFKMWLFCIQNLTFCLCRAILIWILASSSTSRSPMPLWCATRTASGETANVAPSAAPTNARHSSIFSDAVLIKSCSKVHISELINDSIWESDWLLNAEIWPLGILATKSE